MNIDDTLTPQEASDRKECADRIAKHDPNQPQPHNKLHGKPVYDLFGRKIDMPDGVTENTREFDINKVFEKDGFNTYNPWKEEVKLDWETKSETVEPAVNDNINYADCQPFRDCATQVYEREEQPVLREGDTKVCTGEILSKDGLHEASIGAEKRSTCADLPDSDEPFSFEEVAQTWANIAEVMPEYRADAEELLKTVAKRRIRDPIYRCKDSVYESCDILKLAGVMDLEEDCDGEEVEDENYRSTLLNRILEDMPNSMTLGLDDEWLMVNGIPTKIPSRGIELAFVGLAELTTPDDAIEAVSKLVRKKLKRLF